eukprot:SAG22_NODE_1970_length_3231_cov_4.101533_4_plen_138_part_00
MAKAHWQGPILSTLQRYSCAYIFTAVLGRRQTRIIRAMQAHEQRLRQLTCQLGSTPASASLYQSTTAHRAAIIGATGAGDYGHGLELLFMQRPDIPVVAVADAGDAKKRGTIGASLLGPNHSVFVTAVRSLTCGFHG